MQVNVLEAKNRLSKLLRSAQQGEEVLIANRGRGVAKLVGLERETMNPSVQPGNVPPSQPGWNSNADRHRRQAVADVHERLQSRVAELDIEVHEDEFGYGRKFDAPRKARG